jgi:uncharacterized protein (DUF433 family)
MPTKRTILRDLRDDVEVASRFWPKVAHRTPGLCWPWIGAIDQTGGYGRFVVDRYTSYAHRVVWVMTHGPVPEGMDVLHHCDNPPCVNLAHLYLGDHTRNMQDRKQRGRAPVIRGALNPQAVLTEQNVLDIRARWRAGEREATIAPDYPVARHVIYKVATYRSWKHVP